LISTTRAGVFPRRVVSLPLASFVAVGILAVLVSPARADVGPQVANSALAKTPLPAILGATESSAEDIVDFALAGDRGNTTREATRLKAAADGEAAETLTRFGVPAAEITRLKQRASRVAQLARAYSFIAVALAANAVSQLMPDLYRHFRNPVPTSILTLDYLDREAQLRSLAGQPEKIALAVRRLRPTWAGVRLKVIAAGGATEAAAYQRHVTAMNRLEPTAARQVQAEAVRGLELVDDLERVFVR
jgi:hypothetical protein